MHEHLNGLHAQIQTLSRHRDLAERMCGAALEILETLVTEAQKAGVPAESYPTLHKLATSKHPLFVEVENVRIARMKARQAAELEALEAAAAEADRPNTEKIDYWGSNTNDSMFQAAFLEYTRNT